MKQVRSCFVPALLAAPAALLLATTLHAQVAPAPAPTTAAAAPARSDAVPVEKAKSAAETDVVQMSPFEVSANDDRGYQAANSLSGTRINSKLEDLGASISVVTKDQLTDLAARDINDIFLYEANTEGTGQYSAFTNDRGNVQDDIANNPQGANRVRGLGAANVAVGNFGTTGTIPLDSYNIDSVEISRGPNSTVFGLGNTGGGVNVITARARTDRDRTSVNFAITNGTGRRASIDMNRVVFRNKLAFRVTGLYSEKAFERRPAEDITKRADITGMWRPFSKTTLRAGFSTYRNRNSRPNNYTPRDMYSDWVRSGKPTWDPMTETVHLADGTSITGVTESTEKTKLPFGLSVYDSGLGSRPSWYIDKGEVQLYMVNRLSTTALPNNVGAKERLLLNGTELGRDALLSTTKPLYVIPGTTDRSYYDYTSVNLAAPNWSKVKGETYNYEIEQYLLETPRHMLAFQGGFFREDTFTENRTFIGTADGAKMQVYIDVNEKLLDGTSNPFFLRPFIGGTEPAYKKKPELNDNYRGTLFYRLDLTRENSWLKHLGKHNLAAYGEYRFNQDTGGFIYRDRIISTESWVSASSKTGNTGGSANIFPRYYVGDASGQNVDYAPMRLQSTSGEYLYRYFDGVNKRWITEAVDFGESFGGGQYTKRLNSTVGGVWQGYFLNDRIIPTLGYREDHNRSKRGDAAGAATLETGGFYDLTTLDNFTTQPWIKRQGKTKNAGIVVKPLSWLGLHYSQSDSFKPSSIAYDVWGVPLPDPKGSTKDYGLSLRLFGGKLVIRATQYETLDINARSTLGTIVQRAIRLDSDGGAGTGGDPDLQDFLEAELVSLHPDWTAEQVDAETMKLMKTDPALIESHRSQAHSDVNDAQSKGKEIEIFYNPTNYWTLKANVTQQKAMDTNMSPALQQYIDSRWQTWTTITGPQTGKLWWKSTIGSTTPESWYFANVNKDLKLATTTAGKPRPQTREWRANLVSNFKLSGITSNAILRRFDVTTALRYEGKVSLGFLAGAPDVDGIVRTLDGNKPIWDKARAYMNLGVRYTFRTAHDRVLTRLQLNVSNVFENGSLRPVAYNPDGTPYQFRIIDPREITVGVTFDL